MNILRLLLFEECNRQCSGCCNKDFDLPNLPVCTDYKGYDQIILTGGEPMLHPDLVLQTIRAIRKEEPKAKIYVYTAMVEGIRKALDVLREADGVTVTLHNQDDVIPFLVFSEMVAVTGLHEGRSLRVNVFENVNLSNDIPEGWKAKLDIQWIKNCPLPKGEMLMRLETKKG